MKASSLDISLFFFSLFILNETKMNILMRKSTIHKRIDIITTKTPNIRHLSTKEQRYIKQKFK